MTGYLVAIGRGHVVELEHFLGGRKAAATMDAGPTTLALFHDVDALDPGMPRIHEAGFTTFTTDHVGAAVNEYVRLRDSMRERSQARG